MTDVHSTLGWEWTEEQRDSIKSMHRSLSRSYRDISNNVTKVAEALPDYLVDAKSSSKEFLEAAKDLLQLDPRRKGKKWQHIPHSAVAEKLVHVMKLHHVLVNGFFMRSDLKVALKRRYQTDKDALEVVVDQVLEEILALKRSAEALDLAVAGWRDQLNRHGRLVYGLREKENLSFDEAAFNHWIAVKYVLIAANLASPVREYVDKNIKDVNGVDEIFRDVHLRLIQHAVDKHVSELKKGGTLLKVTGPTSPTAPYFREVLRTIHRLLTEMPISQFKLGPTKWDCTIGSLNFELPKKATPLSIASNKGYFAVAEYWSSNISEVNKVNEDGATPLINAVIEGQEDVVKLLIAHGAEVRAKLPGGETPCHIAAKNGLHRVLKLLLDAGGDVNSTDLGGTTPLSYAIESGQIETISILIEMGANVNALCKDSLSPLLLAVKSGNTVLAEFLISKGADVNSKNDKGETSCHIAARGRFNKLIELLIASGSDLNTRSEFGSTPLSIAAAKGYKDIVELLIAGKADVNIGFGTSTPLLTAIKDCFDSIAVLLIANGANVNSRLESGETPLHLAAKIESKKIAEPLIAMGADINAKSDNGSTPLSIAVGRGFKSFVQFLIDNGAKDNSLSSD